jgi:hypothetical protein
MLYSINRNLQYINREGQEEACGTLTNYLEKYKKKVTLLDYFKNYMNEHLLKAGGPRGTAVEANEISRLPYLRTWFRTRRAIVLHLSYGILQVNHPPLPKDHFRKYKMFLRPRLDTKFMVIVRQYHPQYITIIITTTINITTIQYASSSP